MDHPVESPLAPQSAAGPHRDSIVIASRRLAPYWALVPVCAFLALALLGPFLAGDATSQALSNRLQPPIMFGGEWDHPFGTDSLGRDVLARVLIAARLSLWVGVLATVVSAFIGVTLGLVSGSVGGIVDAAVTAIVEVALSVPTIVVGIVLVATLGQSMTNLIIVLVISGWISYARVVRLLSRSLVRSEFIQASVAIGAGRPRIAFRHILPNVLPQVGVIFCQQVAAVMLWEASLTYLGIGLPIERVSLGGMIKEGQQQVFDGWWISVIPGLVIALAVIGFNMLSDWLQVHFDPVQNGGRGRRFGRREHSVP